MEATLEYPPLSSSIFEMIHYGMIIINSVWSMWVIENKLIVFVCLIDIYFILKKLNWEPVNENALLVLLLHIKYGHLGFQQISNTL